jgi:hypothetical protein
MGFKTYRNLKDAVRGGRNEHLLKLIPVSCINQVRPHLLRKSKKGGKPDKKFSVLLDQSAKAVCQKTEEVAQICAPP